MDPPPPPAAAAGAPRGAIDDEDDEATCVRRALELRLVKATRAIEEKDALIASLKTSLAEAAARSEDTDSRNASLKHVQASLMASIQQYATLRQQLTDERDRAAAENLWLKEHLQTYMKEVADQLAAARKVLAQHAGIHPIAVDEAVQTVERQMTPPPPRIDAGETTPVESTVVPASASHDTCVAERQRLADELDSCRRAHAAEVALMRRQIDDLHEELRVRQSQPAPSSFWEPIISSILWPFQAVAAGSPEPSAEDEEAEPSVVV